MDADGILPQSTRIAQHVTPSLPADAGGEGRGEEVSDFPSLQLSPRSTLTGRERPGMGSAPATGAADCALAVCSPPQTEQFATEHTENTERTEKKKLPKGFKAFNDSAPTIPVRFEFLGENLFPIVPSASISVHLRWNSVAGGPGHWPGPSGDPPDGMAPLAQPPSRRPYRPRAPRAFGRRVADRDGRVARSTHLSNTLSVSNERTEKKKLPKGFKAFNDSAPTIPVRFEFLGENAFLCVLRVSVAKHRAGSRVFREGAEDGALAVCSRPRTVQLSVISFQLSVRR